MEVTLAESEPVLWISLGVMAFGLLGTVLPGLPGASVILASAVVYAYLTGFEYVGVWVLVLMGVFALASLLFGFFGTAFGARRFGASWAGTLGGIVGGLAGGLAGLLFLGIGSLFGLLVGAAGGVVLGEYLRQERRRDRAGEEGPDGNPFADHDWRGTVRAAGGVVFGYLVSAVVQGALGILSVGAFVLALVF